MDEQEQRVVIAEFVGVKYKKHDVCPVCKGITPYECGDDYGITLYKECPNCENTGKVDVYYIGLPDYLNDLNAINHVVECLSNTKFKRFTKELSILVSGNNHKAPTREFFCATAEQRVEALLRTLGLWKD